MMRVFTAAAIHIAPEPKPLTKRCVVAKLRKAAEYVERCVVATGAELVAFREDSLIVTQIAEVVARASNDEDWVSGALDPERALASPTPGSTIPHAFDHLAERNRGLYKRYANDLCAPARTTIPHS
jgi:hypothetical protein